jgi:hypothetical protein
MSAVLAAGVDASVVTVAGVPSYDWYGGCGPTAAGMIIGYWDAHGFANLITAGDGSNSWTNNQQAVKDMIASPGYFTDYYPKPDRPTPPPYHADNCVADFMYASRDPLDPGDSSGDWQIYGMTWYAQYCGYQLATGDLLYFPLLWDKLVSEINAGRPMEFFVDSSADGEADHFVTVFGYDDASGAQEYGFYDPSQPFQEHWYSFAQVAQGQSFGVRAGIWFDPVPEPGTLALMGIGGLVTYVRKRRTA